MSGEVICCTQSVGQSGCSWSVNDQSWYLTNVDYSSADMDILTCRVETNEWVQGLNVSDNLHHYKSICYLYQICIWLESVNNYYIHGFKSFYLHIPYMKQQRKHRTLYNSLKDLYKIQIFNNLMATFLFNGNTVHRQSIWYFDPYDSQAFKYKQVWCPCHNTQQK